MQAGSVDELHAPRERALEYEAAGFVSLWIGDFASEEALDAYLDAEHR